MSTDTGQLSNMVLLKNKLLDFVIYVYFLFFILSISMG